MSKSPLTCFDLKGNIDPSQMPKTKKRTATSKNGIESSTATSREENKKSGKVSKTANGTPKTKTPKAKQAQKAFSAKGSDEKTKERPSDKKLSPLQRAEQAHKIIVKECEELIGHNHSLSDDETKLLVCSKLLECGGGLTKDELITALWDELKKVLKKRTSSESMDYETGDIMIGSFLEAYSKPFLEVYSSVSPCGRSYSVLTREIVNWTAHPDRYYLTPQTDSDDKPMPDYYALYLMYKKKLNDLNDMSAEARKRRASIILLEKKISEYKEELRQCSFFDFKTKREVKNKIADAQKRIDENDRFVGKANSEEQHRVEYQKKLDEVNETINASASRFREVPIQRTGLPRRGTQKRH